MGVRSAAMVAPIAATAALASITKLLPPSAAIFDLLRLRDLLAHIHTEFPNTLEILPGEDAFHDHFKAQERACRLQRQITSKAERYIVDRLILQTRDRARFNSASGRLASSWLTALPISRDTSMSPEGFRMACRFRLGAPPVDDVQQLPALCPDCNRDLRNDPWHPLNCTRQRKTTVYMRHNSTMMPIRRKVNEFFGTCEVGPGKWLAPDGKVPDLLIRLPDGQPPLVVDESIVNPMAPSHLAKAAAEPLRAALYRERAKKNKYCPILPQTVQFIPMVQETLGAFAPGSVEIMRRIARNGLTAKGIPESETFRALANEMAIRIQNGNSFIMHSALALLTRGH